MVLGGRHYFHITCLLHFSCDGGCLVATGVTWRHEKLHGGRNRTGMGATKEYSCPSILGSRLGCSHSHPTQLNSGAQPQKRPFPRFFSHGFPSPIIILDSNEIHCLIKHYTYSICIWDLYSCVINTLPFLRRNLSWADSCSCGVLCIISIRHTRIITMYSTLFGQLIVKFYNIETVLCQYFCRLLFITCITFICPRLCT